MLKIINNVKYKFFKFINNRKSNNTEISKYEYTGKAIAKKSDGTLMVSQNDDGLFVRANVKY